MRGKPRSALHNMHMRSLRWIIGDSRFQETVYSDLNVRRMLGADPVDVEEAPRLPRGLLPGGSEAPRRGHTEGALDPPVRPRDVQKSG